MINSIKPSTYTIKITNQTQIILTVQRLHLLVEEPIFRVELELGFALLFLFSGCCGFVGNRSSVQAAARYRGPPYPPDGTRSSMEQAPAEGQRRQVADLEVAYRWDVLQLGQAQAADPAGGAEAQAEPHKRARTQAPQSDPGSSVLRGGMQPVRDVRADDWGAPNTSRRREIDGPASVGL